MRDNEVIRALKVCIKGEYSCYGCPLHEVKCEGGCQHYLRVQALKIINLRKTESNGYRYKAKTQQGELARLNKQVAELQAEIERLKKVIETMTNEQQQFGFEAKSKIEKAKTEAIKEFVEEKNLGIYDPYTDTFVRKITFKRIGR